MLIGINAAIFRQSAGYVSILLGSNETGLENCIDIYPLSVIECSKEFQSKDFNEQKWLKRSRYNINCKVFLYVRGDGAKWKVRKLQSIKGRVKIRRNFSACLHYNKILKELMKDL